MNQNSRDPIKDASAANPELAKAISGLSRQDVEKLREVLSDPEKTRQVLSTPMAQQMMSRLSGAGGKHSS